jgi:importin-4
MSVENMEDQMVTVLASIITRSHPCQQDLGDEEEEDQDFEGGSSENDWLVIDTALDVILGMAEALGASFAKHLQVFAKPIIKFASSQEDLERSTAVGVIAECIKFVGPSISPLTGDLLPILMHRLSDPNALTKSNAAYAMGQLIANSEVGEKTLPLYPTITEKLESAMSISESRMRDNIAGCFSRMIMRNPTPQFVEEALPNVIAVLPLKEDFEENEPIYQCIFKLCRFCAPPFYNHFRAVPLLTSFYSR